jgi:hypothetical protein
MERMRARHIEEIEKQLNTPFTDSEKMVDLASF